jgi:hypothetical protein
LKIGWAPSRRYTHRRKGVRGFNERHSAISSGEYTTTFLMTVTLSVQYCCSVPARILDKETKTLFPCYGIFSAFNSVAEALHFTLEKNEAEAVSFSFSPCHRVLHRVLTWLAIGDFHTSI